jgi:hypothetical protein
MWARGVSDGERERGSSRPRACDAGPAATAQDGTRERGEEMGRALEEGTRRGQAEAVAAARLGQN